jgi:hypothetical protein
LEQYGNADEEIKGMSCLSQACCRCWPVMRLVALYSLHKFVVYCCPPVLQVRVPHFPLFMYNSLQNFMLLVFMACHVS